jgi:UPF0716 family protein affecting phage T7 exclusion
MPRSLGVLLLAVGALLSGVYAWFGLVWLLSAAAKLTGARALEVAMFVVSPHVAGWFVALGLGVIAFVVGLRLARKHRLSWLGFAADAASGDSPAAAASTPPRSPAE